MAPKYDLAMPNGRSLTWIFDHCLRFPTTYEIPMAVMYKINSHPNEPTKYHNFDDLPRYNPPTETVVEAIMRRDAGIKLKRDSKSSSKSSSTIDAAADFRAMMIHSISHLPSQPCTILPSLLISYIRRCFVSEVEKVDFPHAMYAIDYLKDLDFRWKKEFEKALDTLGITRGDVVDPLSSPLSRRFPGNMAWIEKMFASARDLETYYTQLYLGLRRWTLVNAMMLDPKDKANHIAMLNSLFPPADKNTFIPTANMNHVTLQGHREGLFKYINAVYDHGIKILDPIVTYGARPGYNTIWIDCWETLDKYLILVNQTIDECQLITDPPVQEEPVTPRKGRKVDSGISFGSGSMIHPSEFGGDKPLPNFPLPPTEDSKPVGSSLERLGKEIKRMGLGSNTLKKMKSMSALSMRPRSQGSQQSPPVPTSPNKSVYEGSFFEIDDEKRRRLVAEALRRKPRPTSANDKKSAARK